MYNLLSLDIEDWRDKPLYEDIFISENHFVEVKNYHDALQNYLIHKDAENKKCKITHIIYVDGEDYHVMLNNLGYSNDFSHQFKDLDGYVKVINTEVEEYFYFCSMGHDFLKIVGFNEEQFLEDARWLKDMLIFKYEQIINKKWG